MYRIEFKLENLEVGDVEIGEVSLSSGITKKVFNQTGAEFSEKEDAEYIADIFKRKYNAYPDIYKVTTEVYKCK